MNEPIEDELFGTLSYDASVRWYRAQVEFSPSHRVELSISVEGVDPDIAIERARQIFPRVQLQEAALRRVAVCEKLALYNDQWSQGERIDADEFSRRIALLSVTIHPEGEVELWYADGDLFAIHWIAVSTDSELQFQHVQLQAKQPAYSSERAGCAAVSCRTHLAARHRAATSGRMTCSRRI